EIMDGANALNALADVLRAAGGARHLLEQTWREEMGEGVDVAHGSSTPINYPLIPAPAFPGTSGIESGRSPPPHAAWRFSLCHSRARRGRHRCARRALARARRARRGRRR